MERARPAELGFCGPQLDAKTIAAGGGRLPGTFRTSSRVPFDFPSISDAAARCSPTRTESGSLTRSAAWRRRRSRGCRSRPAHQKSRR